MIRTLLLIALVILLAALAALIGGLPLTAHWHRTYAWRVLRHKWAVCRAGVRLQVPWTRLVWHDMSKLRAEFLPYAEWFCHREDPAIAPLEHARQRHAFLAAMRHHLRVNDHHWEYWTLDGKHDGDLDLDDMPIDACREMVADWMAASRVYDGRWPTATHWPWLASNWHRITLSPLTRERVRNILERAALWQPALEPTEVERVG